MNCCTLLKSAICRVALTTSTGGSGNGSGRGRGRGKGRDTYVVLDVHITVLIPMNINQTEKY